MPSRVLVLLVLVYVSLDFANPLMPGAVSFDADDSVEGVHADRFRVDGDVGSLAPLPIPAGVEPRLASRGPGPRRQRGRAERGITRIRRLVPASDDAASLGEDH